MSAITKCGNVIFLYPERIRAAAEASRASRNGWIVVALGALLLLVLIGLAAAGPSISPDTLDPSVLID